MENKCKAKNPAKCRFHGDLQRLETHLSTLTQNGDFDGYAKLRALVDQRTKDADLPELTGRDSTGFDVRGIDAAGLDRFGFNGQGIHDATGLRRDPDGFTSNGWDEAGFDRSGWNRNGKDINGLHNNHHFAATTERMRLVNQGVVLSFPGWTKTAIDRFLGEPVGVKKAGKYLAHMFSLERIEEVEDTAQFVAWRETSQKRSAAAKTGAVTRAANAEAAWEEAEKEFIATYGSANIEAKWDSLSAEQVRAEAIAHYNARLDGHGRFADAHSEDSFLRRITANYLRHNLTDYDHKISQCDGQPGSSAVYTQYRHEVDTLIKDTFKDIV